MEYILQSKLISGEFVLETVPNRKSQVWQQFSKIIVKETGEYQGYVQCIKCNRILTYSGSRGGTSHLSRHKCSDMKIPKNILESFMSEEMKIRGSWTDPGIHGFQKHEVFDYISEVGEAVKSECSEEVDQKKRPYHSPNQKRRKVAKVESSENLMSKISEKLHEISTKTSMTRKENENECFGRYISSVLADFPPLVSLDLQQKILQLVWDEKKSCLEEENLMIF